jgi:O-antigen ligase
MIYVGCCLLESVTLGPVTPSQLAGLVFLGLWLLEFVLLRRRISGIAVPSIPFVLMIAWSLVTTLWSPNPTLTVSQAVTYGFLFVSALAVADVFREDLALVAYSIVIGGFLAAVLTLQFSEVLAEVDPFDVSGVSQATFADTDQNLLGLQLGLGIAAGCFVLVTARRLDVQLLLVLATITMVAALLRVGSKTGVAALIGIAIVLILVQARTPRKLLIATGVVIAGCGAFAILAQAGQIPIRVIEFLESPQVIDSRLEIINAYMEFRDSWQILGVGAGADADFLAANTGVYLNAHGAHWKIWIELGAIGVVLWLLMVVVLVIGTTRLADRRLVLFSTVPILAYAWTLGPVNNNTMWVIFGVAFSGFILPGRREESAQPVTPAVGDLGSPVRR